MAQNKELSFLHEHITPTPNKEILFEYSKDEGYFISNHWHNSMEIIYIISGALEVQIEGNTRLYTSESIALINSRLIHATKCTKETETLLIQIPYTFLKKYIPDINSIYFNFDFFTKEREKQKKIGEIKKLLKEMLHLANEQPNGEQLHFNAMLFQLLGILYDDFKKEQIVSEIKKHGKNLTRLEPVLEYTNQHYTEPISLSEIASVISLQTEYFCRFFKRNMGITYLQYLNEIRLSHIYNDLLTTDIPLSHLLEIHGFLNYKLFRKMFYEKFGSTPGTMRRNRAIKSELN